MKNIFKFVLLMCCITAQSQLTVVNTSTPAQIVTASVASSGITPFNIKFNNSAASALVISDQLVDFTAVGTNIGLTSGILLTTGKAIVAVGPNNVDDLSDPTSSPVTNDPDLLVLSGGTSTIENIGIIEFDFVAPGTDMYFDYVFGSEEYPEYVDLVNDVFGFFISGPGITGTFTGGAKNIALVPGTTIPISINTVNNGFDNDGTCTNCAYYYNNSSIGVNPTTWTGPTTQYDGFTEVLRSSATLQIGQTYHIKLAIGNAQDNFYDSGVFIRNFSVSIPNISGIMTTCVGSTTQLTGMPGPSLTTPWVSSNTAVATISNTGLVTGVSAGTSIITYTDINGDSSTTTVTIIEVPTPTLSSVLPTCSSVGSTTISNYNAAQTYVFTPSGPTVGAGGVITSMTVGVNYTVTASNSGCTSLASASFSNGAILVTPAVPVITTTSATCLANGTATISNYSAALTYTSTPAGLSVGAGGVVSGFTCGTSYTIRATNASTCFTTSTSFTVQCQLVSTAPTVVTAAATCLANGTATVSNYSATLIYTSTPAGLSVGAGGVVSGFTCGTPYTLTDTCFATSTSFTVQCQLISPTVPIVTTVAATCLADGTATVSNYSAALTYTSTPAGLSVGAGGTVSGFTCGIPYTITATNAATCSAISTNFTVQCQLLSPAVTAITSTVATCSAEGSSTITNYSSSNTYVFTPSGPIVGAGGLISGMIVGTSYTFVVTNGGCTSAISVSFSNAAQLTTQPAPIVTTVAATCLVPGSSSITNYNASNIYTFTPSGPSVGAGGLILGMTVGTSYTVIATDGGCTSGASTSFSNEAQLPTHSVSVLSGCVDLDYVLQANLVSGASYQWFNSAGDVLGTESSIVVTQSGTYEVQVNLNGCLVSEFVNVDSVFCSIPKGVSPNGDNSNDFWDLSNLNVQKAQIFNRYGFEVYSKSNYLNEWNGKSDNGHELPSATYFYVLTFSSGKVKTGWVYLIREN
jgi:gliding motility-associated-like protein